MTSSNDISRSRSASRVASYVLRLMFPLFILVALCLAKMLSAREQLPQTVQIALCLVAIGPVLALTFLLGAYKAKAWWPGPFDQAKKMYSYGQTGGPTDAPAFPGIIRMPIAEAPRGSLAVALIEGRVAIAIPGTELRAPLSGSPCVAHHVRVQQWVGDARWRWETLAYHRRAESYVISDESGHVLIEGDNLLGEPDRSCSADSIKVDFRVSTRTVTHDSRSGVRGLPPAARAYLEANRKSLPSLDDSRRTRVTEALLQEGDVVTVIGPIEERLVPEGAYRAEHGARMLVMAHPPLMFVYLARLQELRWLVAFYRRVLLALVVGGMIGVGIAGSGMFFLALR